MIGIFKTTQGPLTSFIWSNVGPPADYRVQANTLFIGLQAQIETWTDRWFIFGLWMDDYLSSRRNPFRLKNPRIHFAGVCTEYLDLQFPDKTLIGNLEFRKENGKTTFKIMPTAPVLVRPSKTTGRKPKVSRS